MSSFLAATIALVFALAALIWIERHTRRRFVDDRQPWPEERLAQWERRRADYMAAERLRHARIAQAIDARATVQPKVSPRLP